ncbi:MAG TPA: IucA/IucC family protein [Micromonosporaceae bacterium]|nr:IucA/IucC family protein [Micromonosporaceae bacterium]
MPRNFQDTATLASAMACASAAVLARLWGALAREPIAGVRARRIDGGTLTCTLADGRRLAGPAALAEPFTQASAAELTLDGIGYADPAELLRALDLPGESDRLAEELAGSVANLALARAVRPEPDGGPPLLSRLATSPDPLAVLEQSIVDGHPVHPCCRTRTGMSTMDQLRYAPEHRPVVPLALVPIPADRLFVTGDWPDWLRDGENLLLPVHPWQHARYGLAPAHASLPAHPLMSLRTLSLVDRPWHVKTAVDVQMTSAVRTVSPAAVRNGPAVSALLDELARRVPGWRPVPEVAAAAVLVGGEPSRHLAAALRRAPRLPTGRLAMPFAALSAPSPATGRALVTELTQAPAELLGDIVAVTLPPLLRLLDLGVALEAHGQNTLLVLDRGQPSGLLYRDLGGVRVSQARLRAHGIPAPPLHGDIPTDDPQVLRTKLFAAVLGVLGELVATLAREYGEPPEKLWDAVAARIRYFAPALAPGARRLCYSMFTGRWPIKAMIVMRLATDPLQDVWAELANPLEGR